MMPRARRFVLAAHPIGWPKETDFRLEELELEEPTGDDVLIRNRFVSVDPYMRGRINPGKNYAKGTGPGDPMLGATVGQVEASASPAFKPGDWVKTETGWCDRAVVSANALRKLDPAQADVVHDLHLLGMNGLTAYFALQDIGKPAPGETVLCSAAAGGVGSAVGQISRLKGAKTVGIAGGPEKCTIAQEHFGYDTVIDYKAEQDMTAAVARECPNGVDVYFDNVGGEMFDAAMANLNLGARIIICGTISQSNATEPPVGPRPLRAILMARATVKGFLIFDYADQYDEGRAQMAEWLKAGRLYGKFDVWEGLEKVPAAFIDMLGGGNVGKRIIKI